MCFCLCALFLQQLPKLCLYSPAYFGMIQWPAGAVRPSAFIPMCLPCILRSHTCTYRDRDRDRDSFQSLCVCVHRFFSYSLFTGHRLGFFDKLLHQCPLESPCRGTGRKRDGICCSYSFITFCQNKYRRLLFFTVTVAQRRAFKDYLTDVCFCSKDKKMRNKY